MKTKCSALVLLLMVFVGSFAGAYPVGPAVSLEKLVEEADAIFKGTVVSTELVEDDWFKPVRGFAAYETRFKVVTVLKGGEWKGEISFRHYDEARDAQQMGIAFMPQYYHFEQGQTYIVFAKKSGNGTGVYRQLWPNHKSKSDQGVLRCADEKPVALKPIKEVVWNELTTMLRSAQATHVIYAIRQLQDMTAFNDLFRGTGDFSLTAVLTAIHGLMQQPQAEVARTAITVVGCGNPYLSEERTPFWLGTVGSGEVPGLGKMQRDMKNPGGQTYWRELVSIADQDHPPATRALAIRALGLAKEPAVQPAIETWLKDRDAAVRASATVLMADYPGLQTDQRLTALAGDSAPEVRSGVAQSIGFAQKAELGSVLAILLKDKEKTVRRAAAMSLLSFSPSNAAISAVFVANIENPEFYPLFLNALAQRNPEAYLDKLATAVETKASPENWWGGEIPAFTSWKILFKYLQAQPAEMVRSGKLDRYLDAMEKVGNYSSSEPRDIYAFYLQRGMAERAKRFREEAKRKATYDLDYYFKQVDQNPGIYTRE